MHSADRIVTAWQNVEVGGQVTLAPDMALDVALVEVGTALVLRTPSTVGGVSPPFDFTWAFVLQRGMGNTTRLIVRERYTYLRAWAALLVEPVEMISSVMSQKMLGGSATAPRAPSINPTADAPKAVACPVTATSAFSAGRHSAAKRLVLTSGE